MFKEKTNLHRQERRLIDKLNFFNYIKEFYTNIYKVFSYNKKIDNSNFKRYNFDEIKNLNVALETYNKEILNSKKIKIDLFNKIATV